MKVDFFGVYRQAAGGKTLELDLPPGGRLRDVLRLVIERIPALQVELFDAQGALFASIPLYLNGRNPRLLAEGLERVVQPGDVLSLFSPIASGKLNVEEIKHELAAPPRPEGFA